MRRPRSRPRQGFTGCRAARAHVRTATSMSARTWVLRVGLVDASPAFCGRQHTHHKTGRARVTVAVAVVTDQPASSSGAIAGWTTAPPDLACSLLAHLACLLDRPAPASGRAGSNGAETSATALGFANALSAAGAILSAWRAGRSAASSGIGRGGASRDVAEHNEIYQFRSLASSPTSSGNSTGTTGSGPGARRARTRQVAYSERLRARPARARPGEREHFAIGTLTEYFNGTVWTVVPRPDTVNKDDQLNAVADLSPSNAWAMGLVRPAGTRSGNPLIVELGDSRAGS